jgi:glycosyltransferase involved in cell wall biosynthesis
MDMVLCKTHSALEYIKKYTANCQYVGFMSSVDSNVSTIAKNDLIDYVADLDVPDNKKHKLFVHFAGRSPFKGTLSLIQAWRKVMKGKSNVSLFITYRQLNDKFPVIKFKKEDVFQGIKCTSEDNMYHSEFLTEAEMNKLRNLADVYVCPSVAEGWGHYLVEGILSKKLIITTNAPPMNELITKKSGVLVSCKTTVPMAKFSKLNWVLPEIKACLVDVDLLQKALITALDMPDEKRSQMVELAYENMTSIISDFKSNVVELYKSFGLTI